ncbi:hypothetical protein AQUCO_00300561v1 [Aquilegia coerulea]|uniref:Bromo domain-containing protein n=1 Tax=Aquilegia coerulea TaxID=218851 RepID=A0A2G5EZH2_AQUCA|nr:hypothetical protein AQUCO_00300561v1 [Aquilegia coerulea]
MALRKHQPPGYASPLGMVPLKFSNKVHEKAPFVEPETARGPPLEDDVDIDLSEVYFLIMHFLSAGPCHRTYGQFWNELLEHQLLPRRYHAWYSRSGAHTGDENDNGFSFPLSYNKLVERYPHIGTNHLVKLLKQLILTNAPPLHGMIGGNAPNAADVPTLLGSGSFSLLGSDRNRETKKNNRPPDYLRWPHMKADQVRGLSLREIGGGFSKHHRAPSIRAACYAIAKPSTMVQRMENIKKLRGHRDAVYCAIFDRSGRYVITGSDDRLVKIWSMETAFCLASCRGHDGDITDLAVSSNNAWVASASNDCIIRVWRLPDGLPIAVLRGHTGAVTAIAFSPRPSSATHLLSSSDDGTCRIWDIRHTNMSPRVYVPKPLDAGKSTGPSSSTGPSPGTAPPSHQILCCAYNANGTVFVTGSSDTFARVWNACKSNGDDPTQPNYEMDLLSGHENDVNYVQFSGCSVASRFYAESSNEDNIPKFKNSWFTRDNIVTCSRDGTAIIWVPKSRRSHSKFGRWSKAYHLKVPPPPMPPQPVRGGPRQRLLPTPRGVNMIVWSLDNRFVLAAIMDCRICVWNAADGSLVHSLTGHSESTYVLDVHPFNPRVAMSAGYDGKTIVWDIWEGTPLRIYDIGRFKLVDGKFSPDGTSIILSDDVGQIYILNTGQGESQKDAKYDQFFLGDYRTLIQDTHGNVLDQETQLAPYWRNIHDMLCDSSMMPYPEPYQSMYQQRRLGALGIERRYSSVNFSVGPVDVNSIQDYQMVPLPDLDRIIEPLPEFLDAMDWEPENEVQSEDNDSEYNVTDDPSEGEKGSLGTISSGDSECSAEDSEDDEHSLKDGLRRSNRKKSKEEVEFMTSSGRRVKRKNLDECDGTSSRINRTRKARKGKKSLKRKSSRSKSLRPQRVAARNARNFLSRINGVCTDEDVDNSEDESSDGESILAESDFQSNESDRSVENLQQKISKGKEVSLDEVVKASELQCQTNARNKMKLVLKLPSRDSKLALPTDYTRTEVEKKVHLDSLFEAQENIEVSKNHFNLQGPGSSSGSLFDPVLSQNKGEGLSRVREQPVKVEDYLDLSTSYQDNNIKWGEVKVRTSKRVRHGDINIGSNMDEQKEIRNSINGHCKPESEYGIEFIHSETLVNGDEPDRTAYNKKQQYWDCTSNGASDYTTSPDNVHKLPLDKHQKKLDGSLLICNSNLIMESKDQSEPRECRDYEEPLEVVDPGLKKGTGPSKEVEEASTSMPTKLRIRMKTIWEDPRNSTEPKSFHAVEDRTSSGCDSASQGPLPMVGNLAQELTKENERSSRFGESSSQIDNISRISVLQESKKPHEESTNRMYNAVYKRSKPFRSRAVSENDGVDMEESTSNGSNNNADSKIDFPDTTTDGVRRTRSMAMKATTRESYNEFQVRGHRSVEASRSGEKFACEQLLSDNWGIAKVRGGLRSARNRRENYSDNNLTPLSKRNLHQSLKKLSWLMLSEHEENYRYIPQLGDEVAYLRQGHEGYIEWRHHRSKEKGPWTKFEGLRAVEFCKVEELEYSTFTGSGESCCKVTLGFLDRSSSVFGKTFKLTLPELNDYSDFLVERTRYDASMNRNWTKRDKCQVWWRNDNEEGGSWYDGRIVAVQPRSPDFPDSPWERYAIQYKSDADQHLHSPWELHEPDTPWFHPSIEEEMRKRLLSSLAKLEQQGIRNKDRYGLQKLEQASQKSDFLNRFPVPLTFEVIQSRLDHNYYRSLEAVKHDFIVMLVNAQSYFVKNEELKVKLRRLSDWFNEKLLPL